MGHAKGAYWYGSRLSIEEARRLVPYNNATSLQVTAAVLAGMVWAMENPRAGIVEPDEIDHVRCWRSRGLIWARWSASTATGRRWPIAASLLRNRLDPTCPWQFKNFRVL